MATRDRSRDDDVQSLAGALPRVARETLAEENARFRTRAPLACAMSSGTLQVSPSGEHGAPAWEGGWTRLTFRTAGREGRLWLPVDLVAGSLASAFPDADLEGLDGSDQATLLEVAERDALDALCRVLRCEITLTDIASGTPPDDEPDLNLEVSTQEGTRYPVRLFCHPVERERIVRLFALQPVSRTPFQGLAVTIAFRCGHTSLTLEEFSCLEPGCGITFDDTTLGFQKLIAVLAERYVQTCAWQTIKPALEGPMLKRADPLTKLYTTIGFAMNDPQGREGHASGSVAEVPINLVFELGRTEVPLSDLESIQAGYVFDLAKPLSQSVDILANGRRVGTGELVRVGESIGVRVVRLIR